MWHYSTYTNAVKWYAHACIYACIAGDNQAQKKVQRMFWVTISFAYATWEEGYIWGKKSNILHKHTNTSNKYFDLAKKSWKDYEWK